MFLLWFYASAALVTRENSLLYCVWLRWATIRLLSHAQGQNECFKRTGSDKTQRYLYYAGERFFFSFPFESLPIVMIVTDVASRASDREIYFGQTVFVLTVTCVTIDKRPRSFMYKNYLPSGSYETEILSRYPPLLSICITQVSASRTRRGYWTSFQYGRKYTSRMLSEMKNEPSAPMNFS